MDDITNEERADTAKAALDAFEVAAEMQDAGEDMETVMGDLLCNLRHLAAANQIDFGKLIRRSEMHFLAETGNS